MQYFALNGASLSRCVLPRKLKAAALFAEIRLLITITLLAEIQGIQHRIKTITMIGNEARSTFLAIFQLQL